jgi:hypothetical protein
LPEASPPFGTNTTYTLVLNPELARDQPVAVAFGEPLIAREHALFVLVNRVKNHDAGKVPCRTQPLRASKNVEKPYGSVYCG